MVDDNEPLAENIGEILALDGASVDVAADGSDALTLLGAARYDFVMTDMNMPRVSGLALIRQLERLAPGTPLAVMSACSEDAALGAARRLGALAVFAKPVDLARLASLATRLKQRETSILFVSHDAQRRVEFVETLLDQPGLVPIPARSDEHARAVLNRVSVDAVVYDLERSCEGRGCIARHALDLGKRAVLLTTEPGSCVDTRAGDCEVLDKQVSFRAVLAGLAAAMS